MNSGYRGYKRLPVYLLFDCSSSMKGDPITAEEQGFKNIVTKLINDPHTSEIVWASAIVYNSTPRQLVPLVPICDLRTVPLVPEGCSNLGKALIFVRTCIEREVKKTTESQLGDWKPLIILMSDGKPSDEWQEIVEELKSEATVIGCGVGADVNIETLKQVSTHVIQLQDQTHATLGQLINMLVSTVSMASLRPTDKSDRISPLPKKQYKKIKIL